jgi:hypothetical protein
MTIHYHSESDFYEGVYQLVKKGLTFKAHFDQMTIELLGGY